MFGIHFDIITVVHQAAITDWIQAVAALLAVPGAIAAFVVLFQRDKQKDEMIAALKAQSASLAEQAKEQQAQAHHLGIIHQVLAEAISQNIQDGNLKGKIRRAEIQPFLRDNVDSFGSIHRVTYVIINSGALATDIALSDVSTNAINLSLYKKRLDRGETLQIVGESQAGRMFEPFTFRLQYKDADGNPYRQQFNAREINLQGGAPELIEPIAP